MFKDFENKEWNLSDVAPSTWGRLIWFVLGAISELLIILHFAPLPEKIASLTPEQITIYVTYFIDVWGRWKSHWKNNSYTISGQAGDRMMHSVEAQRAENLEYEPKPIPECNHNHNEVVGRG